MNLTEALLTPFISSFSNQFFRYLGTYFTVEKVVPHGARSIAHISWALGPTQGHGHVELPGQEFIEDINFDSIGDPFFPLAYLLFQIFYHFLIVILCDWKLLAAVQDSICLFEIRISRTAKLVFHFCYQYSNYLRGNHLSKTIRMPCRYILGC